MVLSSTQVLCLQESSEEQFSEKFTRDQYHIK